MLMHTTGYWTISLMINIFKYPYTVWTLFPIQYGPVHYITDQCQSKTTGLKIVWCIGTLTCINKFTTIYYRKAY